MRGESFQLHNFSFQQQNVEKSDRIYVGCDVPHGGREFGVVLNKLLDLSYRGKHRRVISVLIFGADLLEREICQRADEVHGYLTRGRGIFASVLAAQILLVE